MATGRSSSSRIVPVDTNASSSPSTRRVSAEYRGVLRSSSSKVLDTNGKQTKTPKLEATRKWKSSSGVAGNEEDNRSSIDASSSADNETGSGTNPVPVKPSRRKMMSLTWADEYGKSLVYVREFQVVKPARDYIVRSGPGRGGGGYDDEEDPGADTCCIVS